LPIKFQEKDRDRCGVLADLSSCQYEHLHKGVCIVQSKAAVMKYLHILKYLDINKLSTFDPCILKSSPRKENRDAVLGPDGHRSETPGRV
jgi:hypothetical protein